MITDRAETAMANLLRETLAHPDEVRRLLRAIYSSEADLIPDHKQGTLTVQLHYLVWPIEVIMRQYRNYVMISMPQKPSFRELILDDF